MSEGIFYTLGLNPASFVGGLQKAQSELGKTEGKAGGLMSAIGKLSAAFGAAAAGFGFYKALEKSMEAERAFVAMNTILKDAKATAAVMSQINALKSKSMFSGADFKEAATSLLREGENAAELKDQLQILGDVAEGAGAPLNNIVEIMNRAQIMGGLSSFELRSMKSAGLGPVLDQLKQLKGMFSMAELREEAEKGSISFDDLKEAMRRTTVEGGTFFNAQINQAVTTEGLVKRIKEEFMGLMMVFTNPVNDAIKPMLEKSLEMLEKAKKLAKEFVFTVGSLFKNNRLGGFLYDSLAWAFDSAVVYAARVFSGLGEALTGGGNLFAFLGDGAFWMGIAELGISVMIRIGGALKLALMDAADTLLRKMPKILGGGMDDDASAFSKVERGNADFEMKRGAKFDAFDTYDYQAEGLAKLRKSTDGFFNKLAGGITDFGDNFKKGFDSVPDFMGAGAHADKLKGDLDRAQKEIAMNTAMENTALTAKGKAQAKIAHEELMAEIAHNQASNIAKKMRSNAENLMKALEGASNGVAGAAGGFGGAFGGRMNQTQRGSDPMQQAVKSFLRLSPQAMKQFEFDPFANGGKGQHLGTDEAFKRYMKSRPDLARNARDFAKKNNLPAAGLQNIMDFVAMQPAGFFRNIPGMNKIGQGPTQGETTIIAVLREVKRSVDNIQAK